MASRNFLVIAVLRGGKVRRAVALGEVWVQASLLRRDTSSGVVDEKCVKKVKPVVIETGDDGCDIGTVPLGERSLEVREGRDARPLGFGGGAENPTCWSVAATRKA